MNDSVSLVYSIYFLGWSESDQTRCQQRSFTASVFSPVGVGPHVSFLCLLSSDQVVDLAAAHESDRPLGLFSLYHATVSVCVHLSVCWSNSS